MTKLKRIAVIGAGKIGHAVSLMLTSVSDYQAILIDQDFSKEDDQKTKNSIEKIRCDIRDSNAFDKIFSQHEIDAVISCLPYFCNETIARKAKEKNIHYFDLTEDVKTTETIEELARDAKSIFIPQCGLAPGLINIIANTLTDSFETIESIYLRAGALPQYSNNALHYALTWSTDGLINEYGNPCQSIVNGKSLIEKPLEGLERVILDGVVYEAFNTSGGVGTLWKKYLGKVKTMNYKTLRYPGHCAQIKLLMNDFQLNENRDALKKIIESNVPTTLQDIVVLYVSVTGYQNHQFVEKCIVKKWLPITLQNHHLTAIQCATASGVCAVLDIVLSNPSQFHGFVQQEQFSLEAVIKNRFGNYYAQ